MSYTTLRVVPEGVLLLERHLRRLGEPVREPFLAFAATAQPGVYALRADGSSLEIHPRPGSRLADGMPVRRVPSPLQEPGPLAKPAPPSLYDPVRLPGVATLLTDPLDREVYEESVSAVVGWDDGVVLPPLDRPGVESVSLGELASAMPHRRAPLLVGMPYLLVNAVVLTCAPAGSAFPDDVRRELHDCLAATARRTLDP